MKDGGPPNSNNTTTAFASMPPESTIRSNDNTSSSTTPPPVSHNVPEKPQSVSPNAPANPKSISTHASPTLRTPQNPYLSGPSPDLISSIFPNELPRRPAPKRAPFKRLLRMPVRVTPVRRHDKHEAGTAQTEFQMLDIDLGEQRQRDHQEQEQEQQSSDTSAQQERIRRIKFWALILGGTLLCVMIGMLVYLIVSIREVVAEDRGGR
ncbi:hypothetical protein ACJQWK_06889 [Exserohilum turcicum]